MTYDEYYDDGDDEMTDEAILESNRISLAPSESDIEEAVRVVNEITCDGCMRGYPVKKGWHDTWDDGSVHFLCQKQGRAIVTKLVRLGLICSRRKP